MSKLAVTTAHCRYLESKLQEIIDHVENGPATEDECADIARAALEVVRSHRMTTAETVEVELDKAVVLAEGESMEVQDG